MEDLSNIRKYVECPICLGITREARVVKQCRHRFCKECIEKAMRLSNHKCPICRLHCPSRRSLEVDKDFDNLVASHYPNNNQYEEEELVLNNAEVVKNEQTRATVTQKMKRQAEESTHTQTYELSSDDEEDDKSSGDDYVPVTRKKIRRGVKKEQSIQTNQTNLVLSESLRWGSTSMRSSLVPETSNVHNSILPETRNVRDNILPNSSICERKTENRIERLVCHFQNLKKMGEYNNSRDDGG